MFFEILFAIFCGISAGIITGLIPGIHINLVSIILLSLSPILLYYTNPLVLCVFIIAMSVTHSFLDFVPSVFLGAPDADTALSILPGHKLLLEGKAYEAVKLTVIGSLGALVLAVCLVPLLIPAVSFIYPYLKQYIGWILVFVMVYMIFKDKKWSWNLVVFFMSGVLGLIVLNIPNLKDPLLPMLSGLFGTSMLVISLMDKVNVPPQTVSETIEIPKSTTMQALGAGTFAGTLTSFFPGLGPAQGAVIASQITRNIGDYGFMILVGGINTVNFILSLVTLLTLNKARNGAVIVVSKLIGLLNIKALITFIGTTLVVGGIATFLALFITRIFAKIITKVNYQALIITILLFISVMVFYFSGWLGLLVLLVSTMVSIIPGEIGVPRNHQMGCLILPVILYFLI